MIFADHGGNPWLKKLREFVSWTLTPVVWIASAPNDAAEATGSLQSRAALEEEVLQLREKQLLLESRLGKYASLEAENHRLRELMSSAESLHERVLIAEIIGINQDPYRHQITLNKGSRDGVYRGQALVDAFGILGQIVEVGPATSQALLITDPDHGIPVEINRTGLQTIARGSGDGRGLSLPFLASNADVKTGDLLISSALGGRFPAGYPVGQIYEVKLNAGDDFMEAAAYPSAKMNQGRQALLVWSSREGDDAPLPPADAVDSSSPLHVPAQAAKPETAVKPAVVPAPAPVAAPATATQAKPVESKPATPVTTKPAAAAKPAAETPKPATTKPVTEAPKPAPVASKPVAETPKPAPAATKPAAETPKPAPAAPKPAAEAPKPAPAPAPAATAPKPATQAPKPAAKPVTEAAPAAAAKPAENAKPEKPEAEAAPAETTP